MKCKFCGCTDDAACQIPVVIDEREPGGVLLWAGPRDQADGAIPCYWIAPEICSNPECVKQAYDEAKTYAGHVAANCAHSVELGLIPPEQAEQVMRYLIDHGPHP